MSAINDTPELDYQLLIIESGQSELLGKFYDWLIEEGYVFAKWSPSENKYGDTELFPVSINPNQLFAEFFKIDLNKIEEERRAILEELRNKYD